MRPSASEAIGSITRSLKCLLALGLAACLLPVQAEGRRASRQPLAVVVMDPLAKELACACVRGHAQRNYHLFAKYLSRELGQPTEVSFSEDLADSISKLAPGQHALFVGKHSVIEHDAVAARYPVQAVAHLTGKDGDTTLTGLFVAKMKDPAKGVSDLAGRRVIFGSANADEKYAAALAALKQAGIAIPEKPETRDACADAALDVVDSTENPPPVGVISSYALPLLEGCGSIKKGDLKIIGTTAPIPFVTAYVGTSFPEALRQRLAGALVALKTKPKLLTALETRDGFILSPPSPAGATPRPQASRDWPDFRGPTRDGQAGVLPESLPPTPRVVWKRPSMNGGLAGIAVAEGCVIVADRDPADRKDIFRCLNAQDGAIQWVLDYPAPGHLDYGQFPRATPVIREGLAYLLGAFGDLRCVELRTGKIRWSQHLVRDLGGHLPKWGSCSTPLLVDDLLVVNPGGPKASMVGLDARTGQVRWTSPGGGAAYASFILAELGGVRQIVGYDATSLGGWDPRTGVRLWTLLPESEGDFNVPTPLVAGGRLVVATENNGTRLYSFTPDGKIDPQPFARYGAMAPDTASPVRAGDRVLGVHSGLHCLDPGNLLKCLWRIEDPAFNDHTSLISTDHRALAISLAGEALLIRIDGPSGQILSRIRLFEEDAEVYSHPALVGDRLFIRGPSAVYCLDLSPPAGSSISMTRAASR